MKFEKENDQCTPPHPVGRPRLPYVQMSHRTKRTTISELSAQQDHNTELFLQTACYAVKREAEGSQRDFVTAFKNVVERPTRSSKIKKMLFRENKNPVPLTKEEALAFIIDNNLTKEQYMNIRLISKAKNADIYPSYDFSSKS